MKGCTSVSVSVRMDACGFENVYMYLGMCTVVLVSIFNTFNREIFKNELTLSTSLLTQLRTGTARVVVPLCPRPSRVPRPAAPPCSRAEPLWVPRRRHNSAANAFRVNFCDIKESQDSDPLHGTEDPSIHEFVLVKVLPLYACNFDVQVRRSASKDIAKCSLDNYQSQVSTVTSEKLVSQRNASARPSVSK